jgi:hypothetical protein
MALRLHWPDERYVRIYIRDTPDWLGLSFDAQGLYCLLNRKADRRGRIALGRLGRKGVAAILHRIDLWPRLEPALAELEADGCIRVEGDVPRTRTAAWSRSSTGSSRSCATGSSGPAARAG